MNKKPSFDDVIYFVHLEDLIKMREILLSKKATVDNIIKLKKIEEMIERENKRNDYMNKSLR